MEVALRSFIERWRRRPGTPASVILAGAILAGGTAPVAADTNYRWMGDKTSASYAVPDSGFVEVTLECVRPGTFVLVVVVAQDMPNLAPTEIPFEVDGTVFRRRVRTQHSDMDDLTLAEAHLGSGDALISALARGRRLRYPVAGGSATIPLEGSAKVIRRAVANC